MRHGKALIMLALAAASAGGALAANYAALNVAGCFKLPVPGNLRQLMALPLTKFPVYRGVISDSDATTITDTSASWTAGQYAWGVTGEEPTGASFFFIEVTQSNSPYVGFHFYITNNTATTLTIKDGLPTNIAASAFAACGYKIIPAYRIRDVFGEPGNPRLQGGSSITDTNADLLTFWDPTTGAAWAWETPIHYHTNDVPLDLIGHWVQNNLNVDDRPIDRDEGFLLTRRCPVATNLVITGDVSPNAQAIEAWPGKRMFSGGMTVVNVMLKDSGLTNASGFHSGYGSSDTNATVIYGWNPGTGIGEGAWDSPIYFNNTASSVLAGHWVRLSSIADSNYLNTGKAYLMINPHGLDWKRPSPLPQGSAP